MQERNCHDLRSGRQSPLESDMKRSQYFDLPHEPGLAWQVFDDDGSHWAGVTLFLRTNATLRHDECDNGRDRTIRTPEGS
jgi:hypothetical protein